MPQLMVDLQRPGRAPQECARLTTEAPGKALPGASVGVLEEVVKEIIDEALGYSSPTVLTVK